MNIMYGYVRLWRSRIYYAWIMWNSHAVESMSAFGGYRRHFVADSIFRLYLSYIYVIIDGLYSAFFTFRYWWWSLALQQWLRTPCSLAHKMANNMRYDRILIETHFFLQLIIIIVPNYSIFIFKILIVPNCRVRYIYFNWSLLSLWAVSTVNPVCRCIFSGRNEGHSLPGRCVVQFIVAGSCHWPIIHSQSVIYK